MRSRISLLGLAVSVLALAGVIWWASRQEAPDLPSSSGQLAALAGAVGLYALNTLIRAERWHALLGHEGAHPARADTYALTVIGYTGNNVLPARAGDAARVVMLAPRAQTTKRVVIGTLLAERLLDVAVIFALFVVVGYGILGEVGLDKLEVVGVATAVGLLVAAGGLVMVRRNERLSSLIMPALSSTMNLFRSRHGLAMLGLSVVIWAIEAGVWMAVGGSVGFGLDPLEGLYLVALASVFALIPSGPAYAGTQDAATVIGLKALGASGGTAVSYLVMLRFVLVVPITALGFLLLAVRYGGLGRLREAGAEAKAV